MSDTNFIISATDKTKAAFSSVEKGLGTISGKVFSLGGAVAGLAGAAGFGALLKMSGDTADKLAKVSDRTGVTTEKLAGLQYAVEQTSEVSGETFVNSLTKMNAKIAEAAIKGGENAKVIEQMGLSVHGLANMKADEQFAAISDAMRGVSDEGQRAYFAQKLMDEQGVKLVNTMMLGKEGLAEYTREAEAFGFAISRSDAAKIEESNDQMDRLGKLVMGVATTVRVHLSPYISAVAKYFGDAARESNGFKQETISGLEKVTNAVAFMADIWRGLEVVWAGLEVIFWGFVGGVLSGLESLDWAVSNFIDKIPGLEAKPSPALAEWAENARQKVIDAQVSLAQISMQPMPSEGIKKFFAEVQAEAEASAQKVAESRVAMAAGAGGPAYTRDTSEADAKTAEKLAKLDESLLGENERLALHFQEQEFIVEEAYQIGLLTQQERHTRLEQLEAEHHQRRNAIAYNGMAIHEKFATAFRKGDVRNALAFGAELTQGVAQQNKTMFKINKALALANAAIALPDAVMQSFRNGGGYPWGLVPAGLMMATGLAQIAAIKGTQFGSGGSAPSLAGQGGGSDTVNTVPIGSSASASSTPEPLPGAAKAPARDINIAVRGSSIDVATLRDEIAPLLVEAAQDGAFNLNIRTAS